MRLLPRTAWTGSRPPGSRIRLPVTRLVLHHSVTADPGAIDGARLIDRIHKERFGASSGAGYSWCYSPRERTFIELRGAGQSGAHTLGYNATAHALCVLGNFERDRPPAHVVDDLAEFARWHGQQGHGPGRFTDGHRDLGSSACPGRHLYRLMPDINRAAQDPQEDDLTPEQDRMLREVHASLAGRNYADDLRRIRLSLRAIGRKLGLKVNPTSGGENDIVA